MSALSALVAYSDESDISDSEDQLTNNKPSLSTNKNLNEGITPIKDEKVRSLLESVPSSSKASSSKISEDTDTVDDVPTKESWSVIKDIKSSHTDILGKNSIIKKNKKKNKLQMILPSLSEVRLHIIILISYCLIHFCLV